MINKIFPVIIFLCMALCNTSGAQTNGDYKKMAADILTYVNEYRRQKGLAQLQANDVISLAADRHSKNMAAQNIPFGHDGFDDRMAGIAKQVKPSNAFAENVAYGAKTAHEAVDMWLHSKGHRENIEGNYNLTGIGIVKGADGNLYFTEIFVNRK